MKKLMFAMTAVAAGAALAGVDMSGNRNGEKLEAPLKDGVYSITLTHKFLDYTSKSITLSSAKGAKFTTEEDALADAEERYGEKVAELEAAAPGYELPEELDRSIVSIKWTKKGKPGAYCTWSYKFTGPSVNTKGIPATKVQSATIKGLYVVGYGADMDGAYLWNTKVQDYFKNDYVNKKKDSKLSLGYVESVAINQPDDWDGVSRDGKAAAGFEWNETMVGWGTGTANKGESGDYEYVKAVSGNTVDQVNEMYGTWKFQADTSSTKLANAGKSIEEILAKKKVELVK